MSQRTERIDELLRQEIGRALERELADPGIGFVTVTDVETSADLAHARVWVSVIGSEEQRRETLAALRRAMPYVRHSLNSKIRLRRIPELDVRLDDSVERGTRVLHLLNELEAGRDPDAAAAPLESLPTPVPRLPHEGDAPDLEVPRPPSPGGRPRPRKRTGSKPGAKTARGSARRSSR
ncbi:MAG: 30S ribosome-binding factor RbfA [Candidatus Limnocylindrales bacterium]|jgi:ribosome-binding factor A